eukprot:2233683-Rhodomonas_salina.2
MPCPVLTWPPRCAMPGSDVGYRATDSLRRVRCDRRLVFEGYEWEGVVLCVCQYCMLLWCYAYSCTESGYGATRAAVLRAGMVLRVQQY